MIDLHSHIIPHIDDGADDIDVSIAMLQIAAENGTKAIVATPHVIEREWLPAWDKITAGCGQLQEIAVKQNYPLKIYPGAEVAIGLNILETVNGPGPYCINGGRYMLVELPATHIPPFTEDFFFTLQARGISPILAHPERHPDIGRKPEILQEWIRKGILVQMNSSSLTGRMGERAMKVAELLLINNMVHCVGSDAHGARSRTPNLLIASVKIASLIGMENAEQLLEINPQLILNSDDLDVPEVDKIVKPHHNSLIKKWLAGFLK